MRVAQLWRYPVKSLLGERLDEAAVTQDGLEGDRRFAIFDLETGFGLTARRVPEMLFASAHWNSDGAVRISLPDGTLAEDDDALSDWLGRRVELRSAATNADSSYENPVDFEHEPSSAWEPFEGAPGGPFHDSPQARMSLVSTGTIGSWDPRRFRANVVLDGEGEDALVGSSVTLGEVTIEVTKQIDRCVMITRPQAGGVERDLNVLRTIAREREACMAIAALVRVPGAIRVGDVLGV